MNLVSKRRRRISMAVNAFRRAGREASFVNGDVIAGDTPVSPTVLADLVALGLAASNRVVGKATIYRLTRDGCNFA